MSKYEETPPTSVDSQLPSLKDLPSLGSNAGFSNKKVAWGPNVKPNVVPQVATPNVVSQGASKPIRSRTIQEAFTLDLQSQLSITKPEFSRIVQSVKQNHDVSVESTLSKTSRTFLISGLPANVNAGRRELVKKLTKPVTDVVQVPSRAKAAIIGSGGRNIREIQEKFDVKINVARENNPDVVDEDLGDEMADVSIHGDVDSVKLAKDKIMSIVKEETKNSSILVTVNNSTLLPFIDLAHLPLESVKLSIENNKDVVVSGPREDVKLAKSKLQSYFQELESQLKEEQVKIPEKFQFLIDTKEIKDQFNVVVNFHDDSLVSFLGHREKVPQAIAHARSSSTTFAVDALDISKAHSKNLQHAKNLVLYFNKYNVLKQIQDAHPEIKIVLPQPEQLTKADSVHVYISGKSSKTDEIKGVRKELIGLVNEIAPFDTLTVSDLDYELFHKDIKHVLLGSEETAGFVQFGDFYPGDDTILLVARVSNEDFKPSPEEIKESLAQINATLDSIRTKQSNLATQVIDLESSRQDSMLSKGVTLQLILEEVNQEGNNLQLKLHTPEKSQLTLRGSDKAVKLAKKALESAVATSDRKFKDSVEVSVNSVSRLIGVKGSNTQQLREKFDVNVDVPSESSNGKTVEVTVTGVQYNVERAKIYIQQEAKKWADIITKELFVAQKFHRNLMGPQGAYRNRLQDKYNVRIFFPKGEDNVTIRGPSRGVTKAYEELKSLLDFEMENGHKMTMDVPAEHVARVIGKNGDMINDIRADFGVELDFLQKTTDPSVQESGKVQLEITGNRQAIKDAQAKVNSIVQEASDFTRTTLDVDRKYHKTIVGAGGHTLKEIISKAGGEGVRNRTVDVPNADSETSVIKVEGPKKFVEAVTKEINKIVEEGEKSINKELDIPQDKQGALIGPGGFVRRQLESDFYVQLHVPNKGENGKVVLTGLPENVEKAESKILTEIIRDNFDHELFVPAELHEFVAERGAFIQSLRLDYSINVKHGNQGRKATKLVRKPLNIPVDRVRGTAEEKIKTTIEESDAPAVDGNAEKISWRLIYEDFDVDELLADESSKSDDKNKKAVDETKKQESLKKAIEAIEKRIELGGKANSTGYVWSSDPSKFNKIVGPGGSNIKKIRDATGAVINVPRKTDKVNDVVYIKGTKESVENAIEQVLKGLK
ncbi:hypothetical protein ZYGR_0AD06640 [Zygosaccharomyces rouxii]|uniref:ZYRO0G21362p n=2 Tax=Zygosaccharomyces rouxii TaxID=4956 RepID=C5E1I9_ZYGRC|nr:uncharacterized protein ZYRO0G21362g [Zygosaccharomyces rouxii]GAV51481.1 hypothetical protein ZYGR_0AD06640 [Zygosaccharomyces rouxii]CAR29973.1 ZYRO0G21362p [Zygosaccharomyces rouxii]